MQKIWIIHIDIFSLFEEGPHVKEGIGSSIERLHARTRLESIIADSIFNINKMTIDHVGYDDISIFLRPDVSEETVRAIIVELNKKLPQSTLSYHTDYLAAYESDDVNVWNAMATENGIDDEDQIYPTGRFIV